MGTTYRSIERYVFNLGLQKKWTSEIDLGENYQKININSGNNLLQFFGIMR
jgi:hypothetical protein